MDCKSVGAYADEASAREHMCSIGKALLAQGLVAGAAGNMSCLLPDGTFLVTPTGSSLGSLDATNLSKVSADNELLSGAKPTKESRFHIAVMQNNPEIKAIIHLHSTYATAYACLDGLDPHDAIKPITPYVVMRLGKVQVTPYRKPGSPLIAEDLAKVAAGNKAFLLSNHGMVVGGKTLEDALNNAQELEETCKLYFITRGAPVRHLTAEEIAELL